MNLEDEIASALSKEIAKEIDFEVLSSMLVNLGWHRIKLDRFQNREHSVDILEWCALNTSYPYEHFGSTFVFENEGDAVNFSLKWK